MDHVVVDVEIKTPIEALPGGWDDTDKMGVACAVVYEHSADRFRIYGDNHLELCDLRNRLLQADRITGFNIWNFDFPVIWGIGKADWVGPVHPAAVVDLRRQLAPKTNDILRRIWVGLGLNPDRFSSQHAGWGLNAVVENTLNSAGKIGHGADAPKWYQAGDWGRVANYCCDDVALERDLAAFVDRYGYVCRDGRRVYVGGEQVQTANS